MDEQEPAPKIVPGAVTFQDRSAMMKVTAVSAVGTLAYIIEEEALLVRVNNGWQYIAVSMRKQIAIFFYWNHFLSVKFYVACDYSTSAHNTESPTTPTIRGRQSN